MRYRHRLVSASFILIAEVIEVAWRELADGSPRRYDALDFFHAQQFSSLFNNGNFLQKKLFGPHSSRNCATKTLEKLVCGPPHICV